MIRCKMLLGYIAVLVIAFVSYTDGVAVMSVDLGSEYMKIAIVKPGVPMEIALNKESSRKTRTIVAFRDGERYFANQAYTTAVKFPKKAFGYILNVIGKRYNDKTVEIFKQRFPQYDIIEDETRGTVLFRLEDDTLYSPEELLGMILENAKESAEAFAEQPIKDAVITVPAYFHQAERRAVLSAAEMIGLNVLQLMSDNAAVALNYGVFRRKMFNSTMVYYMFLDMGATSTVVTVAGYHVVKIKEGTRLETNPQVVVKGVGYDRTLGGLEMTLRLRDHLATAFNNMKKTKSDVKTNDRAMAKLLKEADRVKHVLSANNDHFAQVEGLLEEKDFRLKVTRAELEEMCADLFERVKKPIEDALKSSEITMGEISEVILMGAATRVPKMQEKIIDAIGRKDLGKSINTDESAAMGAVYQAAFLGKGFKVKTFSVKEGNLYPIVVEFDKHVKADDGVDSIRTVKRVLFGRMNPYPQKKVMTFNKHTEDFSFGVSYGDLDFLTEEEKSVFPSLVLANVTLEGVKDAQTKHKDAESKGVKAHFRMDESGILNLDTVESVFEKIEDVNKTEESTWSKLGSAIGGLFGGKEEDKDGGVETAADQSDERKSSKIDGKGGNSTNLNNTDHNNTTTSTEPPPQETPTDSTQDKTTESSNKATKEEGKVTDEEQKPEVEMPKPETKPDEEPKTEKPTDDKSSKEKTTESDKGDKKEGKKSKKGKKEKGSKDSKDKSTSKKNETKTEEPKKPKNVILKEDIKTSSVNHDLPTLTEEKMKESVNRLKELRRIDKEKVDLEKAKNNLESYIFNMQDKMSQDLYMGCSTEEEQENMNKLFSESSDWLYETPDDTKKEAFKQKLKALKDGMKDILMRVKEKEERPKALEALKNMLNHSEYFLGTVKNLSKIGDEAIFTDVEVTTLEKLVNETRDWTVESLKELKSLKDNENPKIMVESIAYKIHALDREVKYLVNKAKNFKPKAKPKIVVNDTGTGPSNTTKTKSDGNTTTTIDIDSTEAPPSQEEVPPVDEESTDKSKNTDSETVESETTEKPADDGEKGNTPRTDL